MGLRNMIYDGKKFPEFCAENNIPFNKFEERFNRMRKNKKLNEYSDEYLVDYIIRNFYSNKSAFGCKYYVGNTTLAEYARQNGMTSYSMRGAVRSGLVKDPTASVEELAKAFVERNKNKFKYSYENYPLSIACKKFNISNEVVLKVFHDNYPDMESMTHEEIDTAIRDIVDILRKEKPKSKGLRYEI